MEIATMNKIIVVGIGPGNPDYMLPIARQTIAKAKILVGGRRALSQYATADQQCYPITSDIKAVMDFIATKIIDRSIVVMVSGDPGYFSLLDALKREFPASCIEVIPGISALQLAFAKLALPWHDAKLISFHGRVPAKTALKYEPGSIVGMLTDTKFNSQTIPPLFIEQGWSKATKLHICARLSYDDEQIITTTLAEAMTLPAINSGILIVVANDCD